MALRTMNQGLVHLVLGCACVDLLYTIATDIVLGRKHVIQGVTKHLGGGAINVSTVLAALNPKNVTRLLAALGDDGAAEWIVQCLAERQIDLYWGMLASQATSKSHIFTDPQHAPATIFTEVGARAAAFPQRLVESLIMEADTLFLVSLSANDQLGYLLRLAARENVSVYLALGKAQLELGYERLGSELAAPVALLMANQGEAERLTGTKDITKQVEMLRYDGRVPNVVISAAADGLFYSDGRGPARHQLAFRDGRPIQSDVGAGDSAFATIAHFLARGRSLHDAVRVGARQAWEKITAVPDSDRLLSEFELAACLCHGNGIAAA